MNYVKHFNMFGVEAQQIPCITGAGEPTTETKGAVGCFYMDTDNGDAYKCIKVENDVYTWKKEKEGIIEVELETEHGSDGFIPLFTKEGTVATTLDEVHSGVFKLKYPTMYETILLQTKDYVISDRVDCVNQILWVGNFIRVRVGITEIPTDYLAWDTINLKDIAELKTDKEDISNKSDTIDDTADDTKYPTTKAVKDYVDEKDIYVETKTVYLGDDVLGSASLGEGWSEADSVYTHAKGYTADLTFETEVEENSIYILEFDTSYTANEYIRVGIGDRYRILCYKGSATHVTVPLMASGGTTLYFTPYNDTYAGSISNITLRKIQENGEKRELEIYSTATDNHTQNYGFWNTFIGHDTAENAVGTTRSIAIGAYTLRDLQGGHRNIGIGTFAMSQLIGGEENISIGADSMLAVKNAEACVAMGMAAMYEGASRKEDIAIGKNALRGVSTSETEKNIAIGNTAGYKVTTAKNNVLIGNNAGYNMETGNNNVFVGPLAGRNADSYGCVAIGSQADTEGFSQSTVIGYLAKATKSKQVVLGNDNTVETLLKGDVVVRGTDGIHRQIELATNKSTVIDDAANDTKYPTTKAVKTYVDTSAELNAIVNTAEGSAINITDSANAKLKGLKIFGKTTQAAEPTVENPQPLVSVGDGGSVEIKVYDERVFNPNVKPQTLTLNTPNGLSGVPVSAGGNYTDENGQQWICDEIDLTRGKYVQRVEKITLNSNTPIGIDAPSETRTYAVVYISGISPYVNNSTGFGYCNKLVYGNYKNNDKQEQFYPYDNGRDKGFSISLHKDRFGGTYKKAKVLEILGNDSVFIYAMAEPIETDLNLTEDEIAQYKALTTHKPVTNIYNDADAHMKVDYVADPKTYIDNKFANIENAILSLGGNV